MSTFLKAVPLVALFQWYCHCSNCLYNDFSLKATQESHLIVFLIVLAPNYITLP